MCHSTYSRDWWQPKAGDINVKERGTHLINFQYSENSKSVLGFRWHVPPSVVFDRSCRSEKLGDSFFVGCHAPRRQSASRITSRCMIEKDKVLSIHQINQTQCVPRVALRWWRWRCCWWHNVGWLYARRNVVVMKGSFGWTRRHLWRQLLWEETGDPFCYVFFPSAFLINRHTTIVISSKFNCKWQESKIFY